MQYRNSDWYERDGAPQAIPVIYNGVRFDSKTEARVAVALDVLGLEWHRTPRMWKLPSGGYVPDFGVVVSDVPDCAVWLEAKPESFNKIDPRWEELARVSVLPVLVTYGYGWNTSNGLPRVRLYGANSEELEQLRDLFSPGHAGRAWQEAREWVFDDPEELIAA